MKKIFLGTLAVAIVAFVSFLNASTLMSSLNSDKDVNLESLLSEASAYPEESTWNDSDVKDGVDWPVFYYCNNGTWTMVIVYRVTYMCIIGSSVDCHLHPSSWYEDVSYQEYPEAACPNS
jgi:hypothetical protein